jgi:hypothetical protein
LLPILNILLRKVYLQIEYMFSKLYFQNYVTETFEFDYIPDVTRYNSRQKDLANLAQKQC